MVAAAAAAVGAIPGILGAFLSYYGMKEQQKFASQQAARQENMFNQQRADEKYQFDTGLAARANEFGKTFGLQERTAAQQYKLAGRGMDLQEKQVEAQLADAQLAREEAKRDKIMSGKMLQLNNLTRFFNTPESRMAMASIWR